MYINIFTLETKKQCCCRSFVSCMKTGKDGHDSLMNKANIVSLKWKNEPIQTAKASDIKMNLRAWVTDTYRYSTKKSKVKLYE